MGPSPEDDAEFLRELAKMEADTSADGRKVDKKTALAMWESSLPPPVLRKKRNDEVEDEENLATNAAELPDTMTFTLFTKRGNKPQVWFRFLCVCTVVETSA